MQLENDKFYMFNVIAFWKPNQKVKMANGLLNDRSHNIAKFQQHCNNN